MIRMDNVSIPIAPIMNKALVYYTVMIEKCLRVLLPGFYFPCINSEHF